ncbi:MAG: hypothetical protein JEY79_13925 [Pseudodesulfovibrio sp.]|nr:hypothetical protein [Pseudodesulfovibrio sp.]
MEIFSRELGYEIDLAQGDTVFFARYDFGEDHLNPKESIYENWECLPAADQTELRMIHTAICGQLEKYAAIVRRNENRTPTYDDGSTLMRIHYPTLFPMWKGEPMENTSHAGV